MMNTIRLLQGTFHWRMTNTPTSIDIVLNQAPQNRDIAKSQHRCKCPKDQIFLSRTLHAQSNNIEVLRDITNITSRTPLCLASRPNDTELNDIIKVNNMLSNFVITYFFQPFQTTLFMHSFIFTEKDQVIYSIFNSGGLEAIAPRW